MLPFTKASLLVCLAATTSFANNTRFLPGDSFFFARLDAQTVASLLETKSPTFSYGNHWDGGVGCGYFGYTKLQINEFPVDSRQALKRAFERLKPKIEPDATNHKKMNVFFYNHDYDWKKYGLGLQYNENWVDETVMFGAPRDQLRLESFSRFVANNWRDSTLIPKLAAQCPKLPNESKGIWLKTPVQIDSKKCRLLIIPNRNFDDYYHPGKGAELIEIHNGQLKHWVSQNHEWQPK